MKIILLSALTASALVTFTTSPTLAQSTPAEAAEQATAQAAAADARGAIADKTTATVGIAPAVIAAPAIGRTRPFDSLIASHAASNGVPAELVHRVVVRESRYRASAMGRGGASGLMQIKLATARSMGYTGTAAGLLDPDTNLTYGVRYLAGAYRVAKGNHGRTVGYYASGYYYAAKRQRAPIDAYARAQPASMYVTAEANSEPVTSITREVRRKQRNR